MEYESWKEEEFEYNRNRIRRIVVECPVCGRYHAPKHLFSDLCEQCLLDWWRD